MDIEQAIDIIYTGLVSEKSVPVRLASFRILDIGMLDHVREALDFATKYYKGKPFVPKKLQWQWLILKEHLYLTAVLMKKCSEK